MKVFQEFKEFAVKGNVLDMAVGIIIGGAFGTIATSMVNDVIMPPIGMLLNKVDFKNLYVLLSPGTKVAPPYANLEAAKAAGAVTLNYGLFVNAVVSFLMVAFTVFLLVRAMNRLRRKMEEAPAAAAAATTHECPFCYGEIDLRATKCKFCGSAVESAPASA